MLRDFKPDKDDVIVLLITFVSTMACILLMATMAQAKTVHLNDIKNYPKVIDMYKRYDTKPQPKAWLKIETGVALLNKINNEVNEQIIYKDTERNRDYWQTPAETTRLHTGDCEDFAIMKWHQLLKHGIPETDMWFLLGFNTNNQMHATLQVLMDGRFYYLDNEIGDINRSNIKPLGSYIINRFGVTYYFEDQPQ